MTDRDIMSDAPPPRGGCVEGGKVMAAIGIDRYRAWPVLDNAVNDALGAIDVFQQLGFEALPSLLKEAATAEAIRRLVIDDLATFGGGDDRLVLFRGARPHADMDAAERPLETALT